LVNRSNSIYTDDWITLSLGLGHYRKSRSGIWHHLTTLTTIVYWNFTPCSWNLVNRSNSIYTDDWITLSLGLGRYRKSRSGIWHHLTTLTTIVYWNFTPCSWNLVNRSNSIYTDDWITLSLGLGHYRKSRSGIWHHLNHFDNNCLLKFHPLLLKLGQS
jgi:hypothetical protein